MASSKVINVNDGNFEAEVLNAQTPVLLDFSATWCGPCKQLSPLIDNVAEKHGASVKVGKIDIDESPNTANRFGIRSVPTVLVFKGGKEVSRQVGLVPEAKLVALFQPHVG